MENLSEQSNLEKKNSSHKLLLPSLLPFLSEIDANRDVKKRNENLRETNELKASQKRLEEVFGSAFFTSADRLLEDWLHLLLDEDGNLILQDEHGHSITSPAEIFPVLFKTFNEATRLVAAPDAEGQASLFKVPEFNKPKTLTKAINDYDANRELLITISNSPISAVA